MSPILWRLLEEPSKVKKPSRGWKKPKLQKSYDEFIKRNYQPERAKSVHPSSIGECARVIFFKVTEEHPIISAQAIRARRRGEAFHTNFLSELEVLAKDSDLEYCSDVEFEFSKEFGASGRMDAKLGSYGVEVKSCPSFFWKDLQAPRERDVSQLTYYLVRSNLTKGLIIYENNDTKAQKWFEVEPTKEEREQVLSRFRQLNRFLKDNVLPPRECEKLSPRYQSCVWRTVCDSSEKKLESNEKKSERKEVEEGE